LLLGPTGSGKTPLGDGLERTGLRGRRCHHFDFGANLRAAVAGRMADLKSQISNLKSPSGQADLPFAPEEIRFLRRVLEQGALLEDQQFPLAARILDAFLARRSVQANDWLILNGLPRHAAQAAAVDRKVKVIGVIQLDCDAATVAGRLQRDSGGDRARRADDTDALVARKLAIYAERTLPLLHYYRSQGTSVLNVPVSIETRPAEIVVHLEAWRSGY
jgi:adenylate kinase